jgi:hypothetical protein
MLKILAKRLTFYDTKACNYGLTKSQENMVNKIETEASGIAEKLGLIAYHQSDPRGCSLYLIDKTMDNTNYNRGIVIF